MLLSKFARKVASRVPVTLGARRGLHFDGMPLSSSFTNLTHVSATVGLSDEQKEYQTAALNFAEVRQSRITATSQYSVVLDGNETICGEVGCGKVFPEG